MWAAGRIGRTVAATAAIGLVVSLTVGAQSPVTQNKWRSQGGLAPEGDVVQVGNFIFMVANLARTGQFYTALLGHQLSDETITGPYHPEFRVQKVIDAMYNAPGKGFRVGVINVPNSNLALEPFEWEGNHAPVQKRVFDPGAVMLVLQVARLEPAIEAVRQHGGSFVTPNGEPVRDGNRRVLIIRDPDGLFIELINPDQPPPAAEPGYVISARFRYTAVDATRTARFFRDAFGFTVNEAGAFSDDPVLARAMGLGTTLLQRSAGSTVPGTNLAVEFAEYDSKLGGRKIDQGLPRPGTAMLRLKVRDMDVSLAKAKAAGAMVAPGNDPTPITGNGRRLVVLVNPDGLLLQLYEVPIFRRPQ